MKNKLLKTLLIACLIIPCVVLLTACGSDVNWKFWKKTNNTNNIGANVINSVSFATDSWDIIGKVSAAISGGIDPSFFNYAVGDEKTIMLDTSEEVTLQIWGFNHDDLSDNDGKAGITIGMKNLLSTTYQMNSTHTNANSWGNSQLRLDAIMNIMPQLPIELQAVIKLVNKTTTAGNQLSDLIITQDRLFLFSFFEIRGKGYADFATIAEGVQYEYWQTIKNGEMVNDCIKALSNGTGVATAWWLRSPSMSSISNFGNIGQYGNITNTLAHYSLGICFGFCV